MCSGKSGTFTASGVQLGLTNATVPLGSPFGPATSNYYIGEQLTASNAFPGYAYDCVELF